MVPVFVINLARASARRSNMTARIGAASIPFSFVEAIDGAALTPDEVTAAAPADKLVFPRPLTPNEVACGLSHLRAIEEGMRIGADYFCVLEDDVILAPGFADFLEPERLNALPPFDALRLYTDLDRWDKPSRIVHQSQRHIVVRMLRPGWGMQGQVYSRDGARKIRAAISTIDAPIDRVLYHDCHLKDLRVLEVRPGTVECDQSESIRSTIGATPAVVWEPTLRARARRNLYRIGRKAAAIRTFVLGWGARSFFSFLPFWR